MKLTMKSKKAAKGFSLGLSKAQKDLETTDAKKRLAIGKRLKQLSENVRKKELSVPPPAKKREPEPEVVPEKRPEAVAEVVAPKPDLTVTVTKTVTKSPEDDPSTETAAEKKKWAARSFFGRHLPVLQCNSCSISRVCPKFKAGYECAYLPYLHNHKISNELDLVKYMKLLVGNSMRRAQLMAITEAANGGMPSLETSEALDMAFRQLKDLHDVIGSKEKSEVSMTSADATIVGSIFGGMKLSHIHEDTKKMKDMALAPLSISSPGAVPQIVPPVALPDPLKAAGERDISSDLLKDVLLQRDPERKGLHASKPVNIEQGEISKP